MARFYRPEKSSRRAGNQVRSQNQYYESLVIERLSDDGRGIVKIAGKTAFIENALAGETVSARLVSSRSQYSEGIADKVISASAMRVEPRCQYYGMCGGCDLQHMALEEQHRFKQQVVIKQLQRWARLQPTLELQQLLPTLVAEEYGYRQRVRLSVAIVGDRLQLGFRKKSSRDRVDITQCPIMKPKLQALIAPLREWLNTFRLSAVSHIELVDADQHAGVIIRLTKTIPIKARETIQKTLQKLSAISWFQMKKNQQLETADGSKVDPRLQYRLTDYDLTLHYHPQDFIQANSCVNQQMIKQALSLLQPQSDETIVDLFCGIGNFALPLSRHAKNVFGIEGVPEMVARAEQNAVINHCINTTFFQADLFHHKTVTSRFKAIGSIDSLLLDPPRAGAKIVCESINLCSPKRIVYVSCDSATFSRDAGILNAQGYKLERLGMMDMFPQTAHSEVMGLFTLPYTNM